MRIFILMKFMLLILGGVYIWILYFLWFISLNCVLRPYYIYLSFLVLSQLLSYVRLFKAPWTSLPGSSIHEIFWARILEWLPLPTPGDLPNPGI